MAKPTLASQIDRYLEGYGSPMAGLGNRFVQAGTKYGVDPRLLVGIGVIESSAGKHLKNPYSFANWGVHLGTRYDSFGNAIDDLARGLYKGYVSQGLTTPRKIVSKYAPSSDGNNEANWARTVSSVMSQVGNGTGWTQRSPTNSPNSPTSVPDFTQPVNPLNTDQAKQARLTGLRGIVEGKDPVALLSTYQKKLATIKTPPGKPDVTVMADANTPAAKGGKGAPGVVALAKQYLGVPYVWGGTTPKGFDCSGLLQYVWAKKGVTIPRVSEDQFNAGKRVTGSLQPGDAVFFHPNSKGLPGHVGMYVGNGQFIHAPHTGDVVKISKLKGYSGYIGARRYV